MAPKRDLKTRFQKKSVFEPFAAKTFEPEIFEPASDSDDTTIARHPHPVYHFDSVHLAVEDSLYRLPKRNLQVSTVFEDMLGPSKSKSEYVSRGRENNESSQLKEPTKLYFGLNGEGESDESPIVLEGIKKDDFESFLKVLYPKRAYEQLDLTLSQWTAVLELAHKWGFDGVRNLAITKLAKLSVQLEVDPVEKVYWANKFEVEEWYEDAYMNLAKREEPLTLEEAQKLGLEFVTKLAHVRERRFSTAHSACTLNVATHRISYGATCGHRVKNCPVSEDELRPIVRKVFGLKTVNKSSLKPLRLSYAATNI